MKMKNPHKYIHFPRLGSEFTGYVISMNDNTKKRLLDMRDFMKFIMKEYRYPAPLQTYCSFIRNDLVEDDKDREVLMGEIVEVLENIIPFGTRLGVKKIGDHVFWGIWDNPEEKPKSPLDNSPGSKLYSKLFAREIKDSSHRCIRLIDCNLNL